MITMWPAGVNLMALPAIFISTCRKRVGSVWMVSGIGPSKIVLSCSPFSSALERKIEETSSMSLIGEQTTSSTSSFPASTLERSRMSLIKASKCVPPVRMISNHSIRSASLLSAPRRSKSAKPMIAFKGVRIS